MQFEILVSLLYRHCIKESSTVIDGGANAGLHSIPMSSLLESGHLYAFEPNPVVFRDLEKKLQDKKIHLHFVWRYLTKKLNLNLS